MKTSTYLLLFIIGFNLPVYSQSNNSKESVAVIQIDSKGFELDAAQMGDITRLELDKLNIYQVVDKYDMVYLIEKNQLNVDNCFGRLCVLEVGKAIQTDKVLTGSVEYFGEVIIVSLRLIDIASENIEKSQVMEFINNKSQVQSMIEITLKKMYDQEVSQDLFDKLTKPFDYENAINTPKVTRLNLNGPRMGIVAFTGDVAEVYKAPKSEGGLDAVPVLFQFGYQFEVNYINEGNFQALFEFIPLITGLDQGLFIPSITLLNGMRSSRNGWEFAFGPTFSIAKKIEGYFDADGAWKLKNEWEGAEENPNTIVERIDSRGFLSPNTGFVFGVGKSFKSGRLNIPVNAFFIPGKNGNNRFGLSVGFNATKY